MLKPFLAGAVALAVASFCLHALAASPASPEAGAAPWSRVEQRTQSLVRMSVAGDEAAVMELMRATLQDPGWTRFERDQALYDFAVALGNLPVGSPGPEALQFLYDYQPLELVPQEDHPDALVPVFNVRAAVAGAESRWRRREAARAGTVLLARGPAALVQAFALHDDPAIRSGLRDALDSAAAGALEAVAFIALGQLEACPELAELAGAAALRAADGRALEELLREGRGPALAGVVRDAAKFLSGSQLERLFDAAVTGAPAENAAIVIAELAPVLRDTGAFESRLLALLGEPRLGSAAALALADQPSAATLLALSALARQAADPLAAARARLALDLAATGAGNR